MASMGIFFSFSSFPSAVFGMALREGREKKGRKKQAIENPVTGSAVSEMHFSIQGTHPCRTSKTGLRSLSILTGSGQHGVCDVVWNNKAHCLCRAHKQQHQPMECNEGSHALHKQRGCVGWSQLVLALLGIETSPQLETRGFTSLRKVQAYWCAIS